MPELTAIFSALGDPSRMQIVRTLAEHGPTSILPLVESLPISRQAATKHIEIMERSGIVFSERTGRQRVVALSPSAVRLASHFLQHLESQWDSRLDALRLLVESDSA